MVVKETIVTMCIGYKTIDVMDKTMVIFYLHAFVVVGRC